MEVEDFQWILSLRNLGRETHKNPLPVKIKRPAGESASKSVSQAKNIATESASKSAGPKHSKILHLYI